MTTRKRFLLLPGALLCASAAMAQTTSPTAVFQLNGNAANSNLTCEYGAPCDYWNLLNGTGNTNPDGGPGNGSLPGHSTGVRTFINGTSAPDTRFGQGTEDFLDISGCAQASKCWSYQAKSTSNKTTLNAAYAADYFSLSGDHIVIFGGDRASENGSTNIGFWLLKDPTVAPKGTTGGGFDGKHVDGDILALSQFTNGGGNAIVQVYEWNHAVCGTASKNLSAGVGQCAEVNLKVLSPPSQTCSAGALNCAITNTATNFPTTTATWATPANGYPVTTPPNQITAPLFFEGGINLSALATSGGCFTHFLMETRSSPTVEAELKDFLLGKFPECSIEVTKACPLCRPDSSNTTNPFQYEVQGTVKNTGGGTLFSAIVTDDGGTPNDTTDDLKFDCGTLAIGATKNWGNLASSPPGPNDCTPTGANATRNCGTTHAAGTCFNSSQNPATNTAHVTSSSSSGPGGIPVNDDSDLATCASCPVSPKIEISKVCTTNLELNGGKVVVRVDFKGKVHNTGNDNLNNVFVSEDQNADGTIDVSQLTLQPLDSSGNPLGSPCTSCTLAPDQFASFSSTYYPSTLSGGATDVGGNDVTTGNQTVSPGNTGRAQFNDTTKGTGTSSLRLPNCTTNCFPTVDNSHTAHCVVCPLGACLIGNIN